MVNKRDTLDDILDSLDSLYNEDSSILDGTESIGTPELLPVDSNLSDVSERDKPWDIHRANADKVRDMYQGTEHDRYAERIKTCSQHLGFILLSGKEGGTEFKLHKAKFCRVRLCPVCQWRRSMMWRARFFKVFPKVQEDYPKARYIFLTLTVRNCPLEELRDTIKGMNEAWHRLVKRTAFSPVLGWIKSVEVTRSKDGLAHPHFHIILMVKPSYFSGTGYISQEKWTELWKDVLRVHYTPVVNVKAIKGKGDKTSIFSALCETLKYSVKESDLTSNTEWLVELTNQLSKTRAVAIGGIFKSYLSESEPEDLIHSDEDEEERFSYEDEADIWFGWRELVRKYISE